MSEVLERPRLSDSDAILWVRLLYVRGKAILRRHPRIDEVRQRIQRLAKAGPRWISGDALKLKASAAYPRGLAKAWVVCCAQSEDASLRPAGRVAYAQADRLYTEHVLPLVLDPPVLEVASAFD